MKLTPVMIGTLSEADDRGEIGYSACARLTGTAREQTDAVTHDLTQWRSRHVHGELECKSFISSDSVAKNTGQP